MYNPRLISVVIATTFLYFGISSAVLAQSLRTEHTYRLDESETRPTASLADVSWLVGSWSGEAFGSNFEEVWNPASAGSKSDIATAQSYWDKAFAGRALTVSYSEDDYRCDQELYRLLLETVGEVPSEATQCLLNKEWVKNKEFGSLLLTVSYLALMGHQDIALEALFSPDVLLNGLQSSYSFFALSDGRWQMPESIRRHPRYHEWWSRPGMAELAAARRANGKSFGLPLPIEGGDDQ